MNKSVSKSSTLLIASLFYCASASAQLLGYDFNLTDGNPAVIIDIDSGSGQPTIPEVYASCNSSTPNTVFGVNFTSGYSQLGTTLYGLEWEGGSGPNIFLYTLADSFCATGTRVGSQPVGFQNLESLAYSAADQVFFSAEFVDSSHQGGLIRIDPQTGIGEAVGMFSNIDIKIVGLSYNSASNMLYGVTAGWASREAELVTIDPQSGIETIIGPTGTTAGEIQSLALVPGSQGNRLLAGGSQLYELNPGTGTATPIGGDFAGTVWALHNFDDSGMSPPPTMTENATFDIESGDLLIPVMTVTGSTDVYELLLNLREEVAPFPFELLSAMPITPSSTENSAVFDTSTFELTIPEVDIAGMNYRVVLSLVSAENPVTLNLVSAELAE